MDATNQAYGRFLDEVERIEGSLAKDGRVYARRDASQTIGLMNSAGSSINIFGINAIAPVHQGREALIKILKKGGNVTVAVLDYKDRMFSEREVYENDCSGRIISELGATLGILDDVSKYIPDGYFTGIEPLELYLHRFPKAATIIGDAKTDDGQMQLNVYPDVRGKRGSEGKTYILTAEDGDAFKAGIDFHATLLGESERVPHKDLKEHRFAVQDVIANRILHPNGR
jgi:hypothetical protein